jgi:phage tail P2-like protein
MPLKLTADFIYSLFPEVVRKVDAEVDTEDESKNKPLYRYTQILVDGGFKFSEQDIVDFLNLFDPDKCPDKYLPLLAALLGFEFPFDLSPKVQRRFIKYIPAFYSKKGTVNATEFVIKELLDYDVEITSEIPSTRTFEITFTAPDDDIEAQALESKATILLNRYKIANSNYTLELIYYYSEMWRTNFSVESSFSRIPTHGLNRRYGFELNTASGSPLTDVSGFIEEKGGDTLSNIGDEKVFLRGCKGEVVDIFTNKNGTKEVYKGENIIVDKIFVLVASLIKDPASASSLYWANGTGEESWDTTEYEPNTGEFKLVTELYRKSISINNIVYINVDNTISPEPTNRLQISTLFDYDESNGDLREFGVFGYNASATANSGMMINHKIHNKRTKTNLQQLQRILRLTIA